MIKQICFLDSRAIRLRRRENDRREEASFGHEDDRINQKVRVTNIIMYPFSDTPQSSVRALRSAFYMHYCKHVITDITFQAQTAAHYVTAA